MRVKLTNRELFRYLKPMLIEGTLIFALAKAAQYLLLGKEVFPNVYLFLFVLAFVAYVFWWRWKRLIFQKVSDNITKEGFQLAVKQSAKKLNWILEDLGGNEFRANRIKIRAGISGERISILRDRKGTVWINSIPNPEANSSYWSRSRNKENVEFFAKKCRDIEVAKKKNVDL